jgi:pyruvate formate lyase activating enzyme
MPYVLQLLKNSSYPVFRRNSFFLINNLNFGRQFFMKGLIFNVKRYAIHDGPGIRVTFFMKGCPLSCRWCHNPEGISPEPEKVRLTNRVGDLEFKKTEIVGRLYSVKDILAILEKERVFIDKSKGGVTFSGGEPLMQFDFLLETLKACRVNGFHTAIDTSGQFSSEKLKKIVPYTDLFLFDLKHLDSKMHKEYTGIPNNTILRNFMQILKSRSEIMVRIPVIPGFNDSDEHINRLRKFIFDNKTDNIRMINLLPYHKIGASKYKKFNKPNKMKAVIQPSPEKMKELKEFFSGKGIRVKIGG